MATYRTQILTPRPLEEVFDYVATFSNAQEWDPGVSSASRSGQGQPELGERFELQLEFAGRTTPFTYEIVELDRPNRVVLRSETKRFTSEDTITVRETTDGTVVDYQAVLTLNGLLGLADPILGLTFDRIADKAADGLREALAGSTVHG